MLHIITLLFFGLVSTESICGSTGLTALNQEQKITVNLPDTLPTRNKLEITLNPCAKIARNESPPMDQCADNTRICMVYSTIKDGEKWKVIATALNDPVSYPINKDPKEFVFKYTGVTYNNEIQKTNLSLSCEGDVQTPTYEKYESNILHITWKTKEVCSVSEDAGNSTVSLFLSFVGWMFYGFAAVMIGFTVYNFAILREPFPNAIPLLHVWTGIWYAIQDSAYWVVGNQYVRL